MRTRERLEEFLSGQGREKSDLVKLAGQFIVEEALEADVDDALGRGYYGHGSRLGHRAGYRVA